MSSLTLALAPTTRSIISTNPDDLKHTTHDSRSVAAKTLELQFGFMIEDYIANGKDRFKSYIEEHRRFCAEFIAKDEEKRGNCHKMKEMKVQHRVWTLLLHLSNSKSVKPGKECDADAYDHYYFNPKAFIDDKFNRNYKLRKLEHVILWLQDIAPEPYFLETGDISYSRTLKQCKEARNPLLKSLDPDVMTRMNIDVHTLSREEMDDFNDEEKLLKVVFELIRKGSWKKAVELCRNYGQHYRAVSMNGRRLFYDGCSTTNDLNGIGGNEEYLMWLRVCNAICINTTSKAEKWIYASLCGNVEELLTFVSSDENDGNWYDLLWVLTVCKKVYVSHNLLTHDLPSYYHNDVKNKKLNENHVLTRLHIIDKEWERILTDFNAMFDWMEETNHAFITKEVDNDNDNDDDDDDDDQVMEKSTLITKLFGFKSKRKVMSDGDGDGDGDDSDYFGSEYNYQYYKICKFIICEKHEDLLQSCWQFINNERLKQIRNGITLDFMRFIIHLYLHLNPSIAKASRGVGNNCISQTFIAFIRAYIAELIECHHYEQIARYCYILPKPQLIETLTDFFISLDTNVRIALIKKAQDVLPEDIIKKISTNISNLVIDQSISQSKEKKEWINMDMDGIQQMSILDVHKIDSLMCLKIVNDNYDEILCRANQLFTLFAKQYKWVAIQSLFDNIYETIDGHAQTPSFIKQCHVNSYECYKLYKLVIDAYETWRKYHDEENIESHEKHRNIELLIQYVRNMLLYTYGWLNPRYCCIQQFNFGEVNEFRAVILERLLHLLYKFIDDAKQYDFCLELTTIFANEKYLYYKLFEEKKKVIRDLLSKAKDAKIEIIKYEQQIHREQHLDF